MQLSIVSELFYLALHVILFIGIGYVVERIPVLGESKMMVAGDALMRLYLSVKLTDYIGQTIRGYNVTGFNVGLVNAFAAFFLQDKLRNGIKALI